MTLRTKFLIALLLLLGTLTVNVGATIWGLRFLDRELAWPLSSVQSVMSRLHEIKRAGDDQRHIVGSDAPDLDAFAAAQASAETAVSELESLPTVSIRSGISTFRNIRDRTDQIALLGSDWSNSPEAPPPPGLAEAIHDRHEVIERTEGRILDDARLAVDHAGRLERLVAVVIAVSVVGALSVSALIMLLVRRWVLVPIERLRQGAERLGQGRFEHRIGLDADDELGRLGAEFDTMAALIKEMQDERVERERLAAIGEMSRRIVHNLRTPLSGIRSLAETTHSELDPGSDLRAVQERIIASVDRFEGWLRDVLRASSPIELNPEPVDPSALIAAVIENHADAAEARRIAIHPRLDDLPERVRADAHHLEHALTALVSNAIEFSPPDSVIGVKAGCADGYWTVEVTDSGPGVPEELHDAVFRPYFSTRAGGTGIGLALVRRVAERHGGSVVLRSPARAGPEARETPGAAFTLRLPVDAGAG